MNHGGQEENVVANWAESTCLGDLAKQKSLINDRVMGQWGLINPNSATDFQTHQGVDNYVTTTDAEDYADAWVVDGAKLSAVAGTKKRYYVDQLEKLYGLPFIWGRSQCFWLWDS